MNVTPGLKTNQKYDKAQKFVEQGNASIANCITYSPELVGFLTLILCVLVRRISVQFAILVLPSLVPHSQIGNALNFCKLEKQFVVTFSASVWKIFDDT